MFIEPHLNQTKHASVGWIEVITGAMFSGKTEELIRRLKRALIAKQQVEIFKPLLDKRFHPENVVSHNKNAIKSTAVDFAEDILLRAVNFDVIGIDESQFFDKRLVEVCNELAQSGKRVIIAGLDMDFSGKPFGPMPDLMACAEYITKLHAICAKCGQTANYSFRKVPSPEKIYIGEKETYEPRCRKCFSESFQR